MSYYILCYDKVARDVRKVWSCEITPEERTRQHDGSFLLRQIMSMRIDAPEEQKRFYKSKAWQRCRSAYIASVGGLCERCLARGFITPGYIVHHKEYIDMNNITDPNVLLSFDNLEYLCLKCHNQEHFEERKRYAINADGSVSLTPPGRG